MTEYNENNEAVPSIEEQTATKRRELIEDLKSLDYMYRYLDFDHAYQALEHTVSVIKSKQESLKKAREVVQEFLSTLDSDDELASELITMFSDLEDPLSLDLEVQEEAVVEATLTIYYYRKPWEKNLPLDSSDISISVEGNYGFDVSDYSVDHVSVN
jgi:flagellin-specific chaperone FliS